MLFILGIFAQTTPLVFGPNGVMRPKNSLMAPVVGLLLETRRLTKVLTVESIEGEFWYIIRLNTGFIFRRTVDELSVLDEPIRLQYKFGH